MQTAKPLAEVGGGRSKTASGVENLDLKSLNGWKRYK